MSETPPETTTSTTTPAATPEPQAKKDPGKMGLTFAIAAAVLLLLWLAVSVRLANNRAKRDSVDRASYSFAMSALPLFDMNSKGQITDSTTLERVCDDMVASGSAFSLAAMLDGNGNVIACSDRKFAVGSKFPGFEADKVVVDDTADGWQAMRPATRGTVRYGTVVLRLR